MPTMRGLQICKSVDAYNRMDFHGSLRLMYKPLEELPPKHSKSINASDVKFTAMLTKVPVYPVLVSVGSTKFAEEDLIW